MSQLETAQRTGRDAPQHKPMYVIARASFDGSVILWTADRATPTAPVIEAACQRCILFACSRRSLAIEQSHSEPCRDCGRQILARAKGNHRQAVSDKRRAQNRAPAVFLGDRHPEKRSQELTQEEDGPEEVQVSLSMLSHVIGSSVSRDNACPEPYCCLATATWTLTDPETLDHAVMCIVRSALTSQTETQLTNRGMAKTGMQTETRRAWRRTER